MQLHFFMSSFFRVATTFALYPDKLNHIAVRKICKKFLAN